MIKGKPPHSFFDSWLTELEKNPKFRLNVLADDLGVTTETLRRIRKGLSFLNTKELRLLWERYDVNPLYQIAGLGPMTWLQSGGDVVNEPDVVYGAALQMQIGQLRMQVGELEQRLKDKEEIIDLQKKLLGGS